MNKGESAVWREDHPKKKKGPRTLTHEKIPTVKAHRNERRGKVIELAKYNGVALQDNDGKQRRE